MAASTVALFDQFRQEIDGYNDTRERLIKASRDVTNLSKKTIFLLHRLALEDSTDIDTTPAKRAAKHGNDSLRQVQAIFATLSIELQGDKFWRYHRQVSPGLQEYIEALSFAYFLDHGSLITFDQVQATLSDPDGIPYFPLPISDYFLGLSDLTGELMRFAISGISQRGGREKASDVCAFVRDCKADFEQISPYIPDLKKKASCNISIPWEDRRYGLCYCG